MIKSRKRMEAQAKAKKEQEERQKKRDEELRSLPIQIFIPKFLKYRYIILYGMCICSRFYLFINNILFIMILPGKKLKIITILIIAYLLFDESFIDAQQVHCVWWADRVARSKVGFHGLVSDFVGTQHLTGIKIDA